MSLDWMPLPRFIPVDFETAYRVRAPWDVGTPQPALTELADRVRGTVLDVGCGTGEHALFYAGRGLEAWGVDLVPVAIDTARQKALKRKLTATFRVGDALELSALGQRFDAVIDSGFFHVLEDTDRARYVRELHAVLKPGGTVHLLCFSDRVPGTVGPRRVTEAELRSAFADGWIVHELVPASFVVNRPDRPSAWRAVLVRSAETEASPPVGSASPAAADLVRQLEAELDALAALPAPRIPDQFAARADVLDRLEFHVIDRLRALDRRSDSLERVLGRAMELTSELADINRQLFERLRQEIASGTLRRRELRDWLLAAGGEAPRASRAYDQLDLLVDGLLHREATPPLALRPREPEMFYYQPTPARVILELLELLPIDAETVLYDLGAGLGHVCILASLLCGMRTVGIEFEPTYCAHARESARRLGLTALDFVNADARVASLAEGTAFFMYTPFRGAMMQEVLQRVALASPHREIWVCTFGTCAEQVSQQTWLEPVTRRGGGAGELALFRRRARSA